VETPPGQRGKKESLETPRPDQKGPLGELKKPKKKEKKRGKKKKGSARGASSSIDKPWKDK